MTPANAEQREPDTPAQLEDWGRRLAARASGAGGILSPWVQRLLHAGAMPAPGTAPAQTSPERGTTGILARLGREEDTTRIWRPDVGSISPATFDRFAEEVTRRYHTRIDRFLPRETDTKPEDETELVLAAPGGVSISEQPGTGPPGEMRMEPPLSPEAFLPPEMAGGTTSTPPPPVEKVDLGKPPWLRRGGPGQPGRVQRSPGVRPMSRVEEITPGSSKQQPPGPGGSEAPRPGQRPGADAGFRGEDADTGPAKSPPGDATQPSPRPGHEDLPPRTPARPEAEPVRRLPEPPPSRPTSQHEEAPYFWEGPTRTRPAAPPPARSQEAVAPQEQEPGTGLQELGEEISTAAERGRGTGHEREDDGPPSPPSPGPQAAGKQPARASDAPAAKEGQSMVEGAAKGPSVQRQAKAAAPDASRPERRRPQLPVQRSTQTAEKGPSASPPVPGGDGEPGAPATAEAGDPPPPEVARSDRAGAQPPVEGSHDSDGAKGASREASTAPPQGAEPPLADRPRPNLPHEAQPDRPPEPRAARPRPPEAKPGLQAAEAGPPPSDEAPAPALRRSVGEPQPEGRRAPQRRPEEAPRDSAPPRDGEIHASEPSEGGMAPGGPEQAPMEPSPPDGVDEDQPPEKRAVADSGPREGGEPARPSLQRMRDAGSSEVPHMAEPQAPEPVQPRPALERPAEAGTIARPGEGPGGEAEAGADAAQSPVAEEASQSEEPAVRRAAEKTPAPAEPPSWHPSAEPGHDAVASRTPEPQRARPSPEPPGRDAGSHPSARPESIGEDVARERGAASAGEPAGSPDPASPRLHPPLRPSPEPEPPPPAEAGRATPEQAGPRAPGADARTGQPPAQAPEIERQAHQPPLEALGSEGPAVASPAELATRPETQEAAAETPASRDGVAMDQPGPTDEAGAVGQRTAAQEPVRAHPTDEPQIRAKVQKALADAERPPRRDLQEAPTQPDGRPGAAAEVASPPQDEAVVDPAVEPAGDPTGVRSPGLDPKSETAAPAAQPSQATVEAVQRARDWTPAAETRSELAEKLLARAASRAQLPLVEPKRSPRAPGPEASGIDLARATGTGPAGHQAPRPEPDVPGPPPRDPGQESLGTRPAERPKLDLPRWPEPVPSSSPTVEQLPARELALAAERPTGWGSAEPAAPLAPRVDGGAGQRVQRLPLAVPLAAPRPQAGAEVVQRVEVPATTTSPEPDEEEVEEWDLDDLARQVYPLIRRMLVIERERLPR